MFKYIREIQCFVDNAIQFSTNIQLYHKWKEINFRFKNNNGHVNSAITKISLTLNLKKFQKGMTQCISFNQSKKSKCKMKIRIRMLKTLLYSASIIVDQCPLLLKLKEIQILKMGLAKKNFKCSNNSWNQVMRTSFSNAILRISPTSLEKNVYLLPLNHKLWNSKNHILARLQVQSHLIVKLYSLGMDLKYL